MCWCCDVVGENDCKTLFVKRMEGNICFTVQSSTGPGNAPIGALLGLGGGLQSL